MERGLLWLPLLATFFWLAWMGWNEYRKVENYQKWAENFEQAKYDIYAVLGLKNKQITWGKPTSAGMRELKTFSLKDVQTIRLLVNEQPVESEKIPNTGKPVLEFQLVNNSHAIKIPFTEISLAEKWQKYLQGKLENIAVEN